MTRNRAAAPALPLHGATLKLCRRLRRVTRASAARYRLRSRHSTRSRAGTVHEGVDRDVVRGRRLGSGAAPAPAERTSAHQPAWSSVHYSSERVDRRELGPWAQNFERGSNRAAQPCVTDSLSFLCSCALLSTEAV